MAQPRHRLVPLDLPGWKSGVCWAAAIVLAILFLASGIWKIMDAPGWAVRVAQLKVPESLSLAAAMLFGIAETVGGVLVLTPRFRRWGSMLLMLLLVFFMVYFAVNYNALRGADCSCFPWVKRVVGPEFFLLDGLLLLLAAIAGVWAKPPESLRSAVLIVGAVVVFSLVSYGLATVRQSGAKAPESILVDGRPYSLEHGKVFLFFFDPECLHCSKAAKKMSQFHWGDTAVVAIPVSQPQYGPAFLQETGLKAVLSSDFEKLKRSFPYTAVPAGVALENGHEKAPVSKFEEEPEPGATLKQLGLIY
jgi:uncharacterized membrane protein YphA (DoxX/SURF4 family)